MCSECLAEVKEREARKQQIYKEKSIDANMRIFAMDRCKDYRRNHR